MQDLNLTNYQVIAILKGHTGCINVLKYYDVSSNYSYLLSGSSDHSVIVWNLDNNFEIYSTLKYNHSVLSIDYTSKLLAIGLNNSDIFVHKNEYFELHSWYNLNPTQTIIILPDSSYIVSGSSDSTIQIWQSESPYDLIATLYGHEGCVNALAVLSKTNAIVSGSNDCTIKIWNSISFELIATLYNHTDCVNTLAIIIYDSNYYIVSGSNDYTIKIWQSESPYECITTLTGHTDSVLALAILPDSLNIVSGSADSSIKIWDDSFLKSNNSRPNQILQGHQDWVVTLAILPHSNHIVSGSRDKTIKIWASKNASYKLFKTLTGHSSGITSLSILPHSFNIISGSSDSTIKIWNSEYPFDEIDEFYSTDSVLALTILPASSNIIVAGFETISIWQKNNYFSISSTNQINKTNTGAINDLIFLNNGDLTSCSDDNFLHVWNMATYTNKSKTNAHNRSCLSLTLLKNGKLVSSSQDKSIKIWSTDLFYNINNVKGYLNNDTIDDTNELSVSSNLIQSSNLIDRKFLLNQISKNTQYCKTNDCYNLLLNILNEN